MKDSNECCSYVDYNALFRATDSKACTSASYKLLSDIFVWKNEKDESYPKVSNLHFFFLEIIHLISAYVMIQKVTYSLKVKYLGEKVNCKTFA